MSYYIEVDGRRIQATVTYLKRSCFCGKGEFYSVMCLECWYTTLEWQLDIDELRQSQREK